MPEPKCAICGQKIDVRKAYWCPDCQMWICYKDTNRGIMGISIPKCPSCGHEFK